MNQWTKCSDHPDGSSSWRTLMDTTLGQSDGNNSCSTLMDTIHGVLLDLIHGPPWWMQSMDHFDERNPWTTRMDTIHEPHWLAQFMDHRSCWILSVDYLIGPVYGLPWWAPSMDYPDGTTIVYELLWWTQSMDYPDRHIPWTILMGPGRLYWLSLWT